MRKLIGTMVLSSCSCIAIAGPWGNDFGLSYDSIAGGMGASTYAKPYTATASVFVAQVFGDDEIISENNQTDVDFLQLGGGFTWTF